MAMLELHVLRSGDKGSCAVVRVSGAEGFLCIDCGVSGATFAQACGQAGLIPFKVQAFLITHCHSNQVKGLKSTLAWLRKRGVEPQVYVEPGVLAASPALQELQPDHSFRAFQTKVPFQVGDVLVRPFRTFHNNEDKGSCYNFRFETFGGAGDSPADSAVLLSDVGVLSREAQGELPHARLLAIETNYDPELLEEAAKANAQVRFAVDVRGNFSNAQAAAVVGTYAWPGLKDVVAMYLSRQYNTCERARAALEGALAQAGCQARVTCSSPDEAVSVLPAGEGEGRVEGDGEAGGEEPRVCLASGDVDRAACLVETDEASGAGGVESHADVSLASESQQCRQLHDHLADIVDASAVPASCPENPGYEDDSPRETAGGDSTCVDVEIASPCASQGQSSPDCQDVEDAATCVAVGLPEVSAEPVSSLATSPDSVALPVYEDVLTCEQAAEAGLVNAEELVAIWRQDGRISGEANITPDAALCALTAAGLLDPRDSMPTDNGLELGLWAQYAPAEDESLSLEPVFPRANASRLWDIAAPLLAA